MRHKSAIAVLGLLPSVVCLESVHGADLKGELKGVLIWFYTLETKEGNEKGVVTHFKQTAGVSLPHHVIHEILPLSPQSAVSRDEDENWFLDLAPDRLTVTKDRPLFLGQVLSITKSGNVPKQLTPAHNVLLADMKFDADLVKYLADRKDLLINDPAITKVRDTLIAANPRILNYVIAVDQFVHDQLDYGVCTRPNTAVDLLTFTKGRCGEYAKLRQSLLRYMKLRRDLKPESFLAVSPVLVSQRIEQAKSGNADSPGEKKTFVRERDPDPKRSTGFREWTDVTGNYRVVARLISSFNNTVHLEKEDGEKISVPLEKLSQKDQAYIRTRRN
jgi:hypothetical protein